MADNYITQDKFLWVRLWMHIKREIETNKKSIKWQVALIVGVVIVTEILLCSSFYDNWKQNQTFYDSSFQDPVLIPLIFSMIALGLFIITIASSMTFSPLRTKAGKINQLMSVGMTSEKFWSRALIYAVAPAILFLASVCIIDFIRCLLVDCIMPIHATFVLNIKILFIDEIRIKAVLLFCAFTACASAFFMTVSVYSPKHSFIKGICIIIALQTAGTWFMYNFGTLFDSWVGYLDLAYWTGLSCLVTLTVVLFIVSYLKYKEIEL